MKMGLSIFGFFLVFGPLAPKAYAMKLTLSISVAGEDKPESNAVTEEVEQGQDASKSKTPPSPWKRLRLIPTKVDILRKINTELTLVDPLYLSRSFATVYSENLFETRPDPSNEGKEPAEPLQNRTKLINFRKNIEGLNISQVVGEDQRSEIRLRGTSYNVFQNFEINQVFILLSNLCKNSFEDNSSDCNIVLPAIQPRGTAAKDTSYVKIRAFIQGTISKTDLSRLPAEIKERQDQFIEENAREWSYEDDSKEKLNGYFLFASYHFDNALEEADAGTPIPESYEWRYALSQVQGRLALIAGDYILERETVTPDSKKVKLERAKVSLKWGQLLIDDPMAADGTFIPWKEMKAPEVKNSSNP